MSKIYPVTLQKIAEEVGVSKMTVSLALRHNPKIPAATRTRIEEAAKLLGYKPNPFLSVFGSHIRSSKLQTIQANLAYLCCSTSRNGEGRGVTDPFFNAFYRGADAHATELGFTLEAICPDETIRSRNRLDGILAARGVTGVILHCHHDDPMEWGVDWARYAVCAIGAQHRFSQFHCVDVDRMLAMQVICGNLTRSGYRKVGLIILTSQDSHHGGIQRFAVSDFQLRQGSPEAVIPHLVLERFSLDRIDAWLRQYRPECVVGTDDRIHDIIVSAGHRIPEDLGFVRVMVTPAHPEFSGIRFDLGGVGAAAVDAVFSRMTTGRLGISDRRATTLIAGTWNSGQTLQVRH